MKDGRTLHFLKNIPQWIVLTFLFVLVLAFYAATGDVYFQRVEDMVLGGLLTSLVGRAIRQTTTPDSTPGFDVGGSTPSEEQQ